jgi:competence protein ComEC
MRKVLDFMPAALGEIISTSIAAQIGIVPVLAMRFGSLSVIFLLANLLAAPIIPLILISGLIFSIFPLRVFALVIDGSLNLLFAVARIFYKNPISNISVTRPNVVWVVCYIAFAVSLFLLFKKFCTRRVFRTIYLLTLSFYLIFIAVFPFVPIKAGAPQVVFFDVGQGDSSLIATSRGKKVLIDCGPDGTSVCFFLAVHCIRRIDLLILTHLHDDHTGGALRICDKFEVERIVIPKFLADSPELGILKDKLKVSGARFSYVASGDDIVLDDGTKIMMYWPGEVIKAADNDANRYSMIFLADIEGSKVLYLSDSDEDAADLALSKLIDDLAGDELDVVKVAHHGDIKTLNRQLFLMTEPHSAVISVGKENRFGHPSSELLEFLKKDGIKYFRTDLDGTIRFKIHDRTLSLVY